MCPFAERKAKRENSKVVENKEKKKEKMNEGTKGIAETKPLMKSILLWKTEKHEKYKR